VNGSGGGDRGQGKTAAAATAAALHRTQHAGRRRRDDDYFARPDNFVRRHTSRLPSTYPYMAGARRRAQAVYSNSSGQAANGKRAQNSGWHTVQGMPPTCPARHLVFGRLYHRDPKWAEQGPPTLHTIHPRALPHLLEPSPGRCGTTGRSNCWEAEGTEPADLCGSPYIGRLL
jgi:hypothetical protein